MLKERKQIKEGKMKENMEGKRNEKENMKENGKNNENLFLMTTPCTVYIMEPAWSDQIIHICSDQYELENKRLSWAKLKPLPT